MIARRLLAAAFLAASLAPVAALAQTATDDQPPATTQAKPDHAKPEHAKPEHAKPEHAKPAHAKRDHGGMTQTQAPAPAGEAAKTAPVAPAAPTTGGTGTSSN